MPTGCRRGHPEKLSQRRALLHCSSPRSTATCKSWCALLPFTRVASACRLACQFPLCAEIALMRRIPFKDGRAHADASLEEPCLLSPCIPLTCLFQLDLLVPWVLHMSRSGSLLRAHKWTPASLAKLPYLW